MKQFIILFFMLFSSVSYSQNVKLDASGNYYSAKSTVVAIDSTTGKTYTDKKSISYPVYKGNKGGLYVWITSKNNKQYRKYLKP